MTRKNACASLDLDSILDEGFGFSVYQNKSNSLDLKFIIIKGVKRLIINSF